MKSSAICTPNAYEVICRVARMTEQLRSKNQIKKFYLKSVHFVTINISSQELFKQTYDWELLILSGAHEFMVGFVLFNRQFYVLYLTYYCLSFFFKPLYCLFINLRLLITLLVSITSSRLIIFSVVQSDYFSFNITIFTAMAHVSFSMMLRQIDYYTLYQNR